jgi:hypothetical protein
MAISTCLSSKTSQRLRTVRQGVFDLEKRSVRRCPVQYKLCQRSHCYSAALTAGRCCDLREDGFVDTSSNRIGANRQLSGIHIVRATVHGNLGLLQIAEPIFNSRCDPVHGDRFCASFGYLALQ